MRVWKHALIALCCLLCGPAWAWGPEGHEVVAHLAARNLTPKAKAQVAALLGGEPEAAMAIASNWADEIRDDRPQTSAWHFVNIEIDGDLRYRPGRDCPRDACVVAQILRDEAVLRSHAGAAAKAEALKFLIHFVGDIHQPLHAGDDHDRGGNMVHIMVGRRRPETLHHIWDTDVVAIQERDPAILARNVDGAFSPRQKASLLAVGSPAAWAEQSAAIARNLIYPQIRNRRQIDNVALATDAQVARLQLVKAGYALAAVLNDIFR